MTELLYLLAGAVIVLLAYRMGLNDRKRVDSGKYLTVNPVTHIREASQAKKEQKEAEIVLNGMDNLMAYDGRPQKKKGA